MFRTFISRRFVVPAVLCFQIVPLVIFPLKSYSLTSQEWWLPMLLCLFSVIALVQILAQKSHSSGPWYLLSFSQGFNIISRMMMVMPHATTTAQGGGVIFNGQYLIISFLAMLLSAFEIWYCELPEVRRWISSGSNQPKAA